MHYVNISPNYVFDIYATLLPNNIDPSGVTEVMKFGDDFWYIDNGYANAIHELVDGNGWWCEDLTYNDIGNFKYSITINSHPELFI